MNILKNFEALFVVTLGVACAANYMLDGAPDTSAIASVATPAMQVVVVSAKRMSAEQKLQSLRDEQSTVAVAGATAARQM